MRWKNHGDMAEALAEFPVLFDERPVAAKNDGNFGHQVIADLFFLPPMMGFIGENDIQGMVFQIIHKIIRNIFPDAKKRGGIGFHDEAYQFAGASLGRKIGDADLDAKASFFGFVAHDIAQFLPCVENHLGVTERRPAVFGQDDVLAFTGKELDSQIIFKLFKLGTEIRLRNVQFPCSFGNHAFLGDDIKIVEVMKVKRQHRVYLRREVSPPSMNNCYEPR